MKSTPMTITRIRQCAAPGAVKDPGARPDRARLWNGVVALVALPLVIAVTATGAFAQTPSAPAPPTGPTAADTTKPAIPPGVPTTPDYVIGPDDVLTIVFWREKDMSGEVAVRPDGKISLPLLNDVQAAGLTPEQLRVQLIEAAGKLIEEPTVTVVVKAINSRKVFVTGQVTKPGPYLLSAPTTVLQLLATAGGLLEYADAKNIRVMRTENGKPVSYQFNYKDVTKGKNLKQNIELKPGDTIIVP
jgi:polysaccharide export outer membrane protein